MNCRPEQAGVGWLCIGTLSISVFPTGIGGRGAAPSTDLSGGSNSRTNEPALRSATHKV